MNKVKVTKSAFVVLAALLIAGTASANGTLFMRHVEQAYEVQQLRVIMYTADSGQVLVSACETCEDISLRVMPQTRLYKSGEELPLSEVMKFRGQEGVVFRGNDSDVVTRIKIY